MQEEIAYSGMVALENKRLVEVLGPGYIVEGYGEVYIYKMVAVQKRSVFGWMHTVTKKKMVAKVRELGPGQHNRIEVHDKEVYEKMKQFGEEVGFRRLVREWPGAAEENAQQVQHQQAKKKPKKMKEVTMESEQLRPRFEQLGDQK